MGMKIMGKKRQFDEEQVLAIISEYFWEHGYSATKVDRLASITGLTKTSLYNAFGNKEALFIKSLDFYLVKEFRDIIQQLDTDKYMSENLELLFNKFFMDINAKKLSYGCLVINSILELASNEPNLYIETTKRYRVVRDTIYGFFGTYVKQNRLTSDMNTDEFTDLFSIFFQGLRVQARVVQSEEVLQRSIKNFLTLIRSIEKVN
ncbi:TetR/AcrR family transcriptional regulator [Shewanella intestini]|uniref:TetR/AcrR family transcriptional regulator n=1 Tax=Shewanella intestini TaxID=2017544 RepID=A0ABS5I6M2_9GAMM|nr:MULTISPECIES: TetR/AcrR family transcriptional regulator [Shewanella]MBR9729641.1 TetR/AcrR family transcriptional regulator [Shewanella intestini]MRG37716.1 TetR family transcriptional regulator [Shewanella sp. XMDDZSB0408]